MGTAKEGSVAAGISDVVSGSRSSAKLDVGTSKITFSKARSLISVEPMEEPPEYPDTPTKLTQGVDSWLD